MCVSLSHGARRVDVEDLVKDVNERFADDFEQRIADGNPPDIEEMLELTKKEDLDQQTTLVAKKAGEKVKYVDEAVERGSNCTCPRPSCALGKVLIIV